MKIRIIKESKTKKLDEAGMEGPGLAKIQDKATWEMGRSMAAGADRFREKAAGLFQDMLIFAKEDPAQATQIAFELAGLIPVVGNIGDVIAMLIASARGKYVEAFFNFLAALPAIGLGARVLQKSFVAAGGAKAFMKLDFEASARAMGEAWKMAGPTFQRTFGSKWVYSISGSKVKVLEDVEAARRELNKVLKNAPLPMFDAFRRRTLSGMINDHFAKIDFLLQVTFAGLNVAFGDDLKTMTGEDFVSADQAYCAEFPQFCKDEATASERPPPRQQYTKVMP